MRKPLLNLDTLVERPKISIDGALHEILSPDELPVLTSHDLGMKSRRMDELMKAEALTDVEQAELTDIVGHVSDTIMEPVPAEIRSKLSDAQRLSVIDAFSTLLLSRKATTAAAMVMALKNDAKPTGETTSPDSSGSTEGLRDGGSTKPRSRS